VGFYPQGARLVHRLVTPYGARMQAAWVTDPDWAAALAALPPELADIYFTPGYHRLHREDAG